MARARNIKPGFFTNDALGELPPLARLLFAGLWTLCDRKGRMEDRPKKIKAEVLPYDDCDPGALLQQLHDAGFIQRYDLAGTQYIQVCKFERHQNPHLKEAQSTIPAPCEHSASTVQVPNDTLPKQDQAGLIQSLESLSLYCVEGVEAPPRAARATRKCPDSFHVTQELFEWAILEAPGVALEIETAKLRDHTFKNPIADWPGAWRNWMRRALEHKAGSGKSFRERDADVTFAAVSNWTGGLIGELPNNIITMEPCYGTATAIR